MAYRGNLVVRAQRYCKQGFRSSSAYFHLEKDDSSKLEAPKAHKLNRSDFIGSRSSGLLGFGEFFQNRRISKTNFSCLRYMSSSTGENVVEMINEMKDVMEVTESSITSQASAVSEVAVAAADSYFPGAAFQYLIDGVHSFSGFNWWTSIAVATILVRVIETPLMIKYIKLVNRRKAFVESIWPIVTKNFTAEDFEQMKDDLIRSESIVDPRLPGELDTRFNKEVKPKEVKPRVDEYARVFKASYPNDFSKHLVPLNRVVVFLSTFYAIKNMVENVPSLKSGGIYWFTDLTTPDCLCMLPFVTAVTYGMSAVGYKKMTNLGIVQQEEINRINDKDYNKISSDEIMKIVANHMDTMHLIVMAVMPVFIARLPTAYHCCWISSNMFTFIFRIAMESAMAKKLFRLQTKVKVEET